MAYLLHLARCRSGAFVMVALATSVALAVGASSASATIHTCGADPLANTANVLCAPSSGPCNATTVIVSDNIDVTSGGCAFDIGGRVLEFRKTFQMTGDGFIKVTNAGNTTITDTGKLKSRGDFVTSGGFNIQGGLITIDSSGTITVNGLIDVSGDSAGTIELTAQGDVVLTGNNASIAGNGIGDPSTVRLTVTAASSTSPRSPAASRWPAPSS